MRETQATRAPEEPSAGGGGRLSFSPSKRLMRSFEFSIRSGLAWNLSLRSLSLIRRSRRASWSRNGTAIGNERIRGQQGCPATELPLFFPSPSYANRGGCDRLLESFPIASSLARSSSFLSLLSCPRLVSAAMCTCRRAKNAEEKNRGARLLEIHFPRFSLFSRDDRCKEKTQTHRVSTSTSSLHLEKKKKPTPPTVAQEAHATPEAQAPPTALEVDRGKEGWRSRKGEAAER